ncbi:unnamed protein product [Fraxinus pennsylvanica]|uniref:Uncharacterized protein n=1 Tax=Fraxinus pennsylvanica TaxID=56036 RepID=A0AAD1ZZS2_9LAMI|nr:unnamed protein product [Fraxinus pennsylvanica]
MLVSLSAKNKMGFIKGTIPIPSKNDSKHQAWQRCNDMVLSWILNSLSPELASSVLYLETPSEIWTDLQERFSQVEKCYYLIGFPVGHKLHGKDVQPPNRNHKVAANQTSSKTVHTTTKIPNQSLQFTSEELSQIKALLRNGKNSSNANYTSISSPFCSSSTLHPSKSDNWIIDNGATHHITTSMISNIPMSSHVSLPNGSQ